MSLPGLDAYLQPPDPFECDDDACDPDECRCEERAQNAHEAEIERRAEDDRDMRR